MTLLAQSAVTASAGLMALALAACATPALPKQESIVSASAETVAHAPEAPAPQAGSQTPRLASGQPDLNGFWNGPPPGARPGGPFGAAVDSAGNVNLAIPGRGGDLGNFEKDFAVKERGETNKPIYKPEHWDKVQDLDWNGLALDPSFNCYPDGVPRMGPPQKIMQLGNEIAFFYEKQNVYRLMYTDGRPHESIRANDQTWMGDSVARWEGDTLVVDTVGFNDLGWIGWAGYFQSSDLHVTERLTRVGDSLKYEAIVDDKTLLLEPWVLHPQTLYLNKDPKVQLWQDLPCVERSLEHITQPNMRG
jgi:hypothetical protein